MTEWRIYRADGSCDVYTDEQEHGRTIAVNTDEVGVTVQSYVGARNVATRIFPWHAITLFQEISD